MLTSQAISSLGSMSKAGLQQSAHLQLPHDTGARRNPLSTTQGVKKELESIPGQMRIRAWRIKSSLIKSVCAKSPESHLDVFLRRMRSLNDSSALYFTRFVPPGHEPRRDKFHYLSEICSGDVLLPVWWRTRNDVSEHLKSEFPNYRVGQFNYHMFLAYKTAKHLQKLSVLFWYLRTGLQLHRRTPFNVIMAYGTNTPAFAATILKWITGCKLIVEIPGVPEDAFRYEAPTDGTLKRFFADRLLYFCGHACDCFKLLYPWQLQKYPSLKRKAFAVFHDFVPISCIRLPQRLTNTYCALVTLGTEKDWMSWFGIQEYCSQLP